MSAPAYVVGDPTPVEEVTGSSDLAQRLRQYGFEACSVSELSPAELMTRAVTALFDSVPIPPTGVDTLVYATCSPKGWASAPEDIEAAVGIRPVRLYGVWLGESGNLAAVLRLARTLVSTGSRHVLVAVGDAVPDGPDEYRAMPNAVTVNGDGAAAVLVSPDGGAYEFEGIGQSASSELALPGRATGLAEYLRFIAGVRRALALLEGESGVAAAQTDWLVTNNYSRCSLDDFADCAGVARDRVYRQNVARHGHVFTVDGLINLADLSTSGATAPGERVLVLSTGPFSWGALGLRINHN